MREIASPREWISSTVVAQQRGDVKSDTNKGVKIAAAATIAAALIGAAASIIVALLNQESGAASEATPDRPRFSEKLFDEAALEGERGVMRVLIENYGLRADEIQQVDCPADQKVEKGNTFTCVVELGGDDPEAKVVGITVLDDDGAYQVDRPR